MPQTGRYRWRTAARRHLPWVLIDLGIAAKGSQDCGAHEWYNHDSVIARCYHCTAGVSPYPVPD
jgi:hypothetical protein